MKIKLYWSITSNRVFYVMNNAIYEINGELMVGSPNLLKTESSIHCIGEI